MTQFYSGAVVITTTKLHTAEFELRLCVDSGPTYGVLDVLTIVNLSLVRIARK